MSSDRVIEVRRLAKCFQIYDRPHHRLLQGLARGRRRYYREFWALRDVSFEISPGETVGVVGRNGSGKSTLLQLICGTLTPTDGAVHTRGRIAALLELGAGFNPEFTGRENVYMNGAVMGMSAQEIDEKLAVIARFADIGDFIDQPVKSYSSGMYLRLAFAVAIHADPDILVVDEALAVGDEAFQRKCFGRIQSIQERGGTILFVSHSAGAVVELCQRALLLDAGELLLDGGPKEVVTQYQRLLFAGSEERESLRAAWRSGDLRQGPDLSDGATASRPAPKSQAFFDPNLEPSTTVWYESMGATIEQAQVRNEDGEQVNILCRGERYAFVYRVEFEQAAYRVRFGMLIKTLRGVELGGSSTAIDADRIAYVHPGAVAEVRHEFTCLLAPGVYFFNAGVTGLVGDETKYLHRGVDVAMFRVQQEPESLATGLVDFLVNPSYRVISKANSSVSDRTTARGGFPSDCTR
jgi:lipopolysaccharide transport system ATP-binding protein